MEKIKSLSYFKDLGGLKTTDGHFVKRDVIFRCCDFSKISVRDYGILHDRLYACFDLRADDEVKAKPDCFANESFYHHFPLLSNEDNPAVTKETRVDILYERIAQPGGMRGHMKRLYRKLVTNELTHKNMRKIFDYLLDNDNKGIIAYHCTQGKDRTGMVSISILLALGVDRVTIARDYMQYNKYSRFKRFWIKVGISMWAMSFKVARELNASLVTRKYYIESAFDEMDKVYGGTEGYLTKAIGLSEEEITKLRKLYLVEFDNKGVKK